MDPFGLDLEETDFNCQN